MHKVVLFLLVLSCNQSEQAPEKAQEPVKEVSECICTMQYQPVCGEDGKQYSNPCMAECAGVKNYTLGECE